LRDRLASALGCEVQVLDPSHAMSVDSRAPNAERFVSAAGLAWQGLGAASLPINLQGERDALRQVQAIQRLAWAVSAISAAAAIGLSAHVMFTTLARKRDGLQTLMKQEQTYQSLRPEIRTVIAQQGRLAHRVDQLTELSRRRSLVPEALERMVEALPDEVWLTKVELTKSDTELSGLLEGHSRSFQGVTKLMDQLKSAVGWSMVKPLATTVTTDQATGKELIAFAVQSGQPLPPVTDGGSAASPSGEAAAGSSTKPARAKPAAKSKSGAKPKGSRKP
jgi:Tfp pilus assembly protein PilN